MTRIRPKRIGGLAFAGLSIGLIGMVFLTDRSATIAPPAPRVSAPHAASPLGGSRQVSFIDPATGLPREPTAAELQALQPLTPPSPPQPIVSDVNGMPGLQLGDDQLIYSVATKTPDGRITVQETTGGRAAARKVVGLAPVEHQKREQSDVR